MTRAERPLGAILPYFGGKRTLAPAIVEELGPHRTYWEPFCGSMAVLLAKPVCSLETVCDLYGDVTNLAQVIQHPVNGPRLYRRLRRVLPSQELFAEARTVCRGEPRTDPLDRAFYFFIFSWLGRNGTVGTATTNNNFSVRYTNRGGSPAVRWERAVQSIPEWRKRMRRVVVLTQDGIAVCSRIADDPGTAIYADPPYLAEGDRYLHTFSPDDHRRLAEILCRFHHARVVVSYYDHPRLPELYPGWIIRRVTTPKYLGASGQRDMTYQAPAPEVLVCNGPSYVGENVSPTTTALSVT